MVTRIWKSAAAICMLLAFSGCASPRQFSMPVEQKDIMANTCPANKACIYVIRPAAMGGAMHFLIKDNDVLVGETGPRSYLAWQRDPGPVNLLSVSEDKVALGFEAQAGQSYYVLQSFKMGILTARSSISQILQDQALAYMKNCKLAMSAK
jgi:hypothetical protein